MILFQGDSITDAGRKKDALDPNSARGLGTGYAAMAAGELLFAHNDLELKCYNRGISGNKLPDQPRVGIRMPWRSSRTSLPAGHAIMVRKWREVLGI